MKKEIKSAEVFLGVRDISQLLFWSFAFSQGNQLLQNYIFKYIKVCYPERCRIDLSIEQKQGVVINVINMYDEYEKHNNHIPVRAQSRNDSISDEARNLFSIFSMKNQELAGLINQKDEIFKKMFKIMIGRDLNYIDDETVSREDINWRIGDAMTLRSFVNKRGLPWPYSKLMADITEHLSKILRGAVSEEEEVSLVRELINKHNKYHPANQLGIVGK